MQAAPTGLASTIAAAALVGTAVSTSTAIFGTKAAFLTTFQKALVTGAFVAVAGAGLFEARQAAQMREQNRRLQQEQAPLAAQIQELQNERDDATNRLGWLAEETAANNAEKAASRLMRSPMP